MYKNRIYFFYLAMLATTATHIFEEIWGRFWILDILGLELYLILNWVLYCIPFIIFYFILFEKRWAYQLGIFYAGFMGTQGIGHILGTLLTGSYYEGFAGALTGILLTFLSIPLIFYLQRSLILSKN